MPVIETDSLLPGGHYPEGHQIYNALDSCITLEVFEAISRLSNSTPEIYNFELALQAPALDMMLRGFKIDEYERQKNAKDLGKRIKALETWLNELSAAVWDRPLNPRSPKQLREFFYGAMKLPKVYNYFHGEKKLSMNREALEKLDLYYYARPIVATILEIRELTKKLEIVETNIDSDGRMRTGYNIAGTESGRWCLDKNTEVLTKTGWKLFPYWNDLQEIAVYSNGKINWELSKKIEFPFDGNLIRVSKDKISFAATPEHKILYKDSHDTWRTTTAGQKKFLSRVPLGGILSTEFVDPNITRVCVMMQADGHILNDRTVRWHFTKQRKLIRCRELLTKAKLLFKESLSEDETYYIYTNNNDWLTIAKKFGSWLLYHDPAVVIDELKNWDGEYNQKFAEVTYYTSDKSNAEWIKTIGHLNGRAASIRIKRTANANWSTAYRVIVSENCVTRVYKNDYVEEKYIGQVYCAETSTGFFLIRRYGEISVTGNSSSASSLGTGRNQQNIDPSQRIMFVADEGWKIAGIDLEQAESREVGLIHGTHFNDWRYLDACESGDLHTSTAKLVWPSLPWTGDLKSDRALADNHDKPFYREFTYRDMAKRGGHGTSYCGTPFTMARHLKVPQKLMEDFQHAFFLAYPAFQRWHTWTAGQIQTKGFLTTPFGRTRHFFGRPDDDSTIREAVAFVPQSATADRLNLALWRIWRYMPEIQLLAQVHDAVYFQFHDLGADYESDIIRRALALIHTPMKIGNRTFDVPGEAKVGFNWGQYDAIKNPDGLMKVRGPDLRKRTTITNRLL